MRRSVLLLLFIASAAFAQTTPSTPPPESPEFQRRAQQLVRSGNLDDALAVYETELKTSPDSVAAHNGAGVVLDLLGRTKEAKTHFNRAIDLAATPVAKANARRALAMSYAFDNDCANTAKVEEMVADYWASVSDYFRQGEILNEAARVCIEAGIRHRRETLSARPGSGPQGAKHLRGADCAMEVPRGACARAPRGAS